jgi:hypothetical protein
LYDGKATTTLGGSPPRVSLCLQAGRPVLSVNNMVCNDNSGFQAYFENETGFDYQAYFENETGFDYITVIKSA